MVRPAGLEPARINRGILSPLRLPIPPRAHGAGYGNRTRVVSLEGCHNTTIPNPHLAEAVRFELTVPFGTSVFKTGALNHSATLPIPNYTPIAVR